MSPNQVQPKPANLHERVVAYIDGFNLYHGMKEANYARFYWLNLSAMCRALLKPHQALSATKYFTSRVSLPAERAKRQGTYIEALQTLSDLYVFEGRYAPEVEKCDQCQALVYLHNEKMTDVNIAVEITKDAHANRFDAALLVTGDSDQTPTILMVKELFPTKRIICGFPPKRVSTQLRRVAHGDVHINAHILAGSQLPPVVRKAGGIDLCRPARWA
jgi:uncharacterized LabA/DUF88 family protein